SRTRSSIAPATAWSAASATTSPSFSAPSQTEVRRRNNRRPRLDEGAGRRARGADGALAAAVHQQDNHLRPAPCALRPPLEYLLHKATAVAIRSSLSRPNSRCLTEGSP